MKMVKIEVELNDSQAWALAQFVKRICFCDYESIAVDKDEAYEMVDANELVRKALADQGIAPR